MDKVRIDGETICADKQYCGKRVLELCNASFNNGFYAGGKAARQLDNDKLEAAKQAAFLEGYKQGAAELMELKRLLNNILGGDA